MIGCLPRNRRGTEGIVTGNPSNGLVSPSGLGRQPRRMLSRLILLEEVGNKQVWRLVNAEAEFAEEGGKRFIRLKAKGRDEANSSNAGIASWSKVWSSNRGRSN